MSLNIGYKQRTALIFHLPAIIVVTLITMVPLVYNIVLSFYDFSLSRPGSRNIFAGLKNYGMIFSDYEYWNSMWVTIRFVIASTLIQLVLGVAIALILYYYGGKLHRLLTSLVIIPMMIAPLVVGLMYSFILNPQFGLYSFLVDLFNPLLCSFTLRIKLSVYPI